MTGVSYIWPEYLRMSEDEDIQVFTARLSTPPHMERKRVSTMQPDIFIDIRGLHSEIRSELRKRDRRDDFFLNKIEDHIITRTVCIWYSYMELDFQITVPHSQITVRKDIVNAVLEKIYDYESLWEE